MSIIDSLYDIQSEKGSLTKPYESEKAYNIENLEKEILSIIGADLWNKYSNVRNAIEIDEIKHHYKHGLMDGAKLMLELLK